MKSQNDRAVVSTGINKIMMVLVSVLMIQTTKATGNNPMHDTLGKISEQSKKITDASNFVYMIRTCVEDDCAVPKICPQGPGSTQNLSDGKAYQKKTANEFIKKIAGGKEICEDLVKAFNGIRIPAYYGNNLSSWFSERFNWSPQLTMSDEGKQAYEEIMKLMPILHEGKIAALRARN